VRYVIYGAGAIGATIGAVLFEANEDVVLIARGEHGRVIAERGLSFGAPDGWRTLRLPVVEHPSEIAFRAGDVVVLAMKSQDTLAAIEALRPYAETSIPIVCAQNGVANESRALRFFENVHGMCVKMPSVFLKPGIVSVHGSPFYGTCDLGRFPHGRDSVDETFAADLAKTSIRSVPRDDIMAYKYAKLVLNLGNVIEAACGLDASSGSIGDRARKEAMAVLAAANVRMETSASIGFSLGIVEGVERPGGSTYQSLARGASNLETDDLNGEIVYLGRMHDVPTPVNAMLQRLALRLVVEHIPPQSMTLTDLERSLSAIV
jgi:2-dehydropantoate 2-reductase